ncbi:MAG: DNA repair protein RecO, partial [Patescibacteria group bacterium]
MFNTDAVILKKIDSGEADALFILYTKEYGKMRALAQGVKKEEAKLRGHLEPLNLTSVSFVLGKNGERLTHATLKNHWPTIRSNLGKLQTACVMADLIERNTMPGERDSALWEFLTESFGALECRGGDESILPKF